MTGYGSINVNDVVQLTKLVGFDILVIRIGHPFAIDNQSITISARRKWQLHFPAAGAFHHHRRGHRLPAVEIAGDQHLLGGLETGGEDDFIAERFTP